MLQSLFIQNYALINELRIDFNSGFSIITGETGAGKSILLGALSLILGQRADSSVLYTKEKKCIVEGVFNIKEYQLADFFRKHDLDYDDLSQLRREVTGNGKSRAFINDTPVTLNQLKELGVQLIDIHSQHQNLELGNNQYQLTIVDSFGKHKELLKEYRISFDRYRELTDMYNDLVRKVEKEGADLDYYQFQYNKLEEANLQDVVIEDLEIELKTLNHAEEIKTALTTTAYSINNDEQGCILDKIRQVMNQLDQLSDFYPAAKELSDRLESTHIELKDISDEAEIKNADIEYDPARIEHLTSRLDEIYSLQQKHNADTLEELIEVSENLRQKIESIASSDDEIEKLLTAKNQQNQQTHKLAEAVSEVRKRLVPEIEKSVVGILTRLGMPNASFKIIVDREADFTATGIDRVGFLFSANKNVDLQEISKVASGGEMSRLMLAVKSLVSRSLALPTIILDEIDTGVSGDVAEKMGLIMSQMARDLQVISITHLPQIAGLGDSHYVVYKSEDSKGTTTNVLLLDKDKRIMEIAKMLSGEDLTEAALKNAKELLKN